jgi:hypothetical protein
VREKRNAYGILVGMLGEKKLLGKHRHSWEDNIKMDVRENRMSWYGLDSSGLG